MNQVSKQEHTKILCPDIKYKHMKNMEISLNKYN